ncbi:hypothetical protein [Rheinheimera sp. NSM]
MKNSFQQFAAKLAEFADTSRDGYAALYQVKHSGRNKVIVAEYCVIL